MAVTRGWLPQRRRLCPLAGGGRVVLSNASRCPGAQYGRLAPSQGSPSPTSSGTGTRAPATSATRRSRSGRRSTSTRSRRASTSSSRTFPASPSSSAGAGKRVLEVGCGIGTDSINFARAGARADGRRSLERVAPHRRAARRGDGRRRPDPVRPGERRGADVGARRASRTTSSTRSASSTTRRIPSVRSREMRALVAPGGTLKLMVYHRRSWKVFWIVAAQGRGRFWKTDELVAKHSEAQTGCPVTFTYTRARGARARRAQRLPRRRTSTSTTSSRTGSATTSSTGT